MKLSSRSRYGLKALYILAENYPDRVSATALERGINVSSKYIEKIMRELGKAGLVAAERGASGGYALSRPPSQVRVGDIVRTLEEEMEFVSCIAGGNKCVCPTKSVWKKLYDGINELLDSITLGDMLEDYANVKRADVCNMDED